MEGGHNIPEDVIIRRYNKGIVNLINVFVNLCDYCLVIDNSSRPYEFIVEGNEDLETAVYNKAIWDKIKKQPNEKS